jgi:sugar lactone lactonase YvrE
MQTACQFHRGNRLRIRRSREPFRRLALLAGALLLAATCNTADAAAGDLYVSEVNTGSVLRFDAAGNRNTFASGLSSPFGLVFDRNGNLFVAEKDTNLILKYTPTGAKSIFASDLHLPTSLAFDATGNLFVADFLGNAILKITPAGTKTTFATGLHNPSGLAFDRAGNLYVSEYAAGTLLKFAPDGSRTLFASGFVRPEEIVFDVAANLFVTDYDTGAITKFTPGGARTTFASGLSGAWGLALDPAGNLLEVDNVSGNIFAFAPDGTKTLRISGLGTPTFIAVEPPTAVPQNISTRMDVLTGEQVMIAGFIIVGSAPKRVMVRGIGPSLSNFGISGVLSNPTLQLQDQGGATVARNDDWKESQESEIANTGIPPTNDVESAVVVTLAPGAYTVIEQGKANGTGVGLVEVYDLDSTANSSLGNISTRGFVETGNKVMIGGFIVGGGNNTAKVLVRGIGPSLAAFGISNPLSDPTIELHNASGALVSSNNDWRDSDPDAIQATGIPPNNDLESAIVAVLPGGNYTAIVSGKNGGIGVGLVEVYNLR